MPLITVTPGQHSLVTEGNVLTLNVFMMWSKQGGGLETGGSNNVIAVYDLDLYLQHQRELKAQGQSGFLETDDTFFRETNRPMGALQDHRVAPGTGVMLLADVTFRFRETPVSGSHFFIERVALQGQNSPQPYALNVRVIGRFDSKGNPLSKGPIGLISLGLASVSRKDFDGFFNLFGNFQRKIAVRVFKPDLSKVLLSNIDPNQSTTSQGKHKVHYKTIGLTRSFFPRNVGDAGTGPQEGAAPATRLRKPDLTGYYVEEVEPTLNEDGVRVIDPVVVVAPAGLFLHQAGHAFVGWYSPLPQSTLISREAGFNPNDDVRNKMLSFNSRIVFVGPMLELPAELQGKVPAAMPPGATPVLYFDDRGSGSSLERDPVDIVRRAVQPVKVGWLRVISKDLIPILELGLENGRKAEFLSLHTGTRLSWEAINEVRATLDQNPTANTGFLKETLVERAEPIAPAVTGKLVGRLVGQEMFELLKKISEIPPLGASTELILTEDKIIALVDSVVGPLKAHHKNRVRLMAESTMRAHSYKFDDGDISVYDRLVTVATVRFERRVKGIGADKGSLKDNIAEHLPKSFLELGLHPKVGFRYILKFSQQGLSGGAFLQGSAGGFTLEITKQKKEGDKFVPDPTFDPLKGSATAKYFGGYLGGGVGFSAGYGFKGASAGGGGSGAPVDCTIDTFHDVTAQQLDRATFNTAAFVKPSFGISGLPIGAGTKFHETVLTLRVSDQVQMSGEVRGEFLDVKVTPPSVDSMRKHYGKWHDAVKSGDVSKVPTPGVNATLVALTASWGILFLRDSQPPEQPKPKKQDDVPEFDSLNANESIDGLFFDTGKAVIDEVAHDLLDVSLATARHLFELEGWLVIFACTSPKFNNLARKDARGQNESLARFRADQTRKAIFASLGEPGGGIIPRNKDIEQGIDVDSAVRETLESAGGVSVLDPHGDVAKTPEGKKVVQREEREIYPLLQRCDIIVNGLLEVRLPTR